MIIQYIVYRLTLARVGDTMHKAVVFIFDIEDIRNSVWLTVIPNEFVGITVAVYAIKPQIASLKFSVSAP